MSFYRPKVRKIESFTLLSVTDSIDNKGGSNRNFAPISATPKRGAYIYRPNVNLVMNNEYRRYFGDKIFEVAYTPENKTISESPANYAIMYGTILYRLNKVEEMENRSGFKFYGISSKPATAA